MRMLFVLVYLLAGVSFAIHIPARAVSVDTSALTTITSTELQDALVEIDSDLTAWANPTNGITQVLADARYMSITNYDGTTISTNAAGFLEVIDIPTNLIVAAHIQDDAITAGKIATGAVRADAIDTGAVGMAELANVSTNITSASQTNLVTEGAVLAFAGLDPLSYTGGETTTLPNGLIIKFGLSANVTAGATLDIVYGTAFPTTAVAVFCSLTTGTSDDADHKALIKSGSEATTMQIISGEGGETLTFYWLAVGY